MLKRYCNKCRHYSTDDFRDYCNIISGENSDYCQIVDTYFEPKKQNGNNLCQYWQPKFSLTGWILNLVNR